MSYPEIKDLTKADLKLKLNKMGMSLDRTKHSKDYYAQLYLDKSNAKNKITRDNTSFYNENIINRKRARTKSNDGEIKEVIKEKREPIYEEEDYEEREIKDISGDLLHKEENKNKEKINSTKRKRKKIDEENNDYRDSGIKITRLIRIKKRRPKDINSTGKKSETKKKSGRKSNNSVRKIRNVRRKIINRIDEDISGEDEYYYYYANKSQNKKERYYPRNKDGTFKKFRKYNNKENVNNQNEMKSAERKTSRKRNQKSYDNSKSKTKTKEKRNRRLNFSIIKNDNIEKSDVKNNEEKNIINFGAQDSTKKNNNRFIVNRPISYDQIENNENVNNNNYNEKELQGKDTYLNVKNENKPKRYNFLITSDKKSENENEEKGEIKVLRGRKVYLKKPGEMEPKPMMEGKEEIPVDLNINDNNGKKQTIQDNLQYQMNNNLDNNENNNIYAPREPQSKEPVKKTVVYDNNNINDNSKDINDNYGNQDNNINKTNEYKVDFQKDKNNENKPMDIDSNFNNQLTLNDKIKYNNDNNIEYNTTSNNNEIIYINNNNSINNINKEDINNMRIDNNNNNKVYLNNENNYYNNNNYEESEIKSTTSSRFTIGSFGSRLINIKNSIMSKYKKYIYLWPLIILIILGILYFLFNDDNYDISRVIIVVSIFMGLIILYNMIKYWYELRKYKKLAERDKKKLLELINKKNIRIEDIGNQIILLNSFMYERIEQHHMTYDEYMKYVFPELAKILKKMGLNLYYENISNDNKNSEFMLEL